MKAHKVFCIGFHKTGTSSLGVALEKLGYRVTGFFPFRDLASQDNLTFSEVRERALEVANQYDAAQDSPWPILYQQLDEAFPGSKFIHVERNREAWIKSAVNDFADSPNAMRNLIYGVPFPKGHEDIWLDRYDRHNREVKEYFASRPGDFISLDMDRNEVNWENLCSFLGEPDPAIPWPHANRRVVKKYKLRFWKLMRKLGLHS